MDTEVSNIKKGKGKWSQAGVPHKGWYCINIDDTGEPSQYCEMCESQEIRYIHHMQHNDYPRILEVGCVCAGHMEEDLIGARNRERLYKQKLKNKEKWLSREWKISSIGNEYIKYNGYIISVYKRYNQWNASIKILDDEKPNYIKSRGNDIKSIKSMAFDYITQQKNQK